MSTTATAPLTDRDYWDRVWTDSEVPSVNPLRDPHQGRLDRRLRRHLWRGARFLEVGAAGSAWPAHVARTYGAVATGIDFSPGGLVRTAAAARRDGVHVELVEGDVFDDKLLPRGRFDVVYSGGFIEHFEQPANVLRRLADLATATGIVITTVPNLNGVNGFLQRWGDPEVFAKHVVYTLDRLDAAHVAAGLIPLEGARYIGALDLGSVDLTRRLRPLPSLVQKGVWRSFSTVRLIAENVISAVGKEGAGQPFAPAILGVYAKPGRYL